MALQTAVGLYRALGVAGDKATPDQSIYYPINMFADEAGVACGTFVWRNADGDATNTQVSGVKPLGIVERNLSYPQYDVREGASPVIAEGQTVMTAVRGDYYVTTTTTATVGQKVFALSNGAIATGAPNGQVSGGLETDWVVVTAGAIGDTIIISNWANPSTPGVN